VTDEPGFDFAVISPTRVVLRERVMSLIVPGARGALGFWAAHAPMLAALAPGVVKYRPAPAGAAGTGAAGGGAASVAGASGGGAAAVAGAAGRGDFRLLAVSGGFFEFGPDGRATLLADTAELPEEIDVARARAAYERAKERLRRPTPETDVRRAELALQRALARLHVARRAREPREFRE